MPHQLLPPSRAYSRRAFLASALAALATGAAGCSSAVGELRQQGAAGDGTPTRGGVLRVGATNDLSAGAGIMTGSVAVQTLASGILFDRLVEYPDPASTQAAPSVATSWESSTDGLTHSFALRDDVVFHSGRPLTSADAEFSLRQYADPIWSAQMGGLARGIERIDASDPHRLTLRLAHPMTNLFDLLSAMPLIDSESVDGLLAGSRYVGTGPFRLAERIPGSRIRFERNESYWQPGRPYLDGVTVSIIPDPVALRSSMRAGLLDFTADLPYRDVENLGNLGGFTRHAQDGAENGLYVGANVAAPQLADLRLRTAIACSVDRDRIARDVFRGYARPASLPWPQTSPAYDAAKDAAHPRDLATARSLVAEIGPLQPIPLTYVAKAAGMSVVAQILQANLAEAGIPITLDPVEQAVAAQQLIGGSYPGLWVTAHSFAQFSPATLALSAYPFNARKNGSNFSDEAYREAADSAWRAADRTGPEAQRAYAAINDALLGSLFLIELAVVTKQVVGSSRMRGYAWTRRGEPLLAGAYLI
jgi:peptide/nickel transport system substrate-binding protein